MRANKLQHLLPHIILFFIAQKRSINRMHDALNNIPPTKTHLTQRNVVLLHQTRIKHGRIIRVQPHTHSTFPHLHKWVLLPFTFARNRTLLMICPCTSLQRRCRTYLDMNVPLNDRLYDVLIIGSIVTIIICIIITHHHAVSMANPHCTVLRNSTMNKCGIANFTSMQRNIQIKLLRELKRALVRIMQMREILHIKMLFTSCNVHANNGTLLCTISRRSAFVCELYHRLGPIRPPSNAAQYLIHFDAKVILTPNEPPCNCIYDWYWISRTNIASWWHGVSCPLGQHVW
mmetsp:Transcript_6550/g.9675  ORF Transcript_6550/g.9675 Transcript_6550/m.9675 type:complete len:288 (-) Transcript_6550:343-1206(-)